MTRRTLLTLEVLEGRVMPTTYLWHADGGTQGNWKFNENWRTQDSGGAWTVTPGTGSYPGSAAGDTALFDESLAGGGDAPAYLASNLSSALTNIVYEEDYSCEGVADELEFEEAGLSLTTAGLNVKSGASVSWELNSTTVYLMGSGGGTVEGTWRLKDDGENDWAHTNVVKVLAGFSMEVTGSAGNWYLEEVDDLVVGSTAAAEVVVSSEGGIGYYNSIHAGNELDIDLNNGKIELNGVYGPSILEIGDTDGMWADMEVAGTSVTLLVSSDGSPNEEAVIDADVVVYGSGAVLQVEDGCKLVVRGEDAFPLLTQNSASLKMGDDAGPGSTVTLKVQDETGARADLKVDGAKLLGYTTEYVIVADEVILTGATEWDVLVSPTATADVTIDVDTRLFFGYQTTTKIDIDTGNPADWTKITVKDTTTGASDTADVELEVSGTDKPEFVFTPFGEANATNATYSADFLVTVALNSSTETMDVTGSWSFPTPTGFPESWSGFAGNTLEVLDYLAFGWVVDDGM